jgi:hypothetical protein
MRHFEKPIARRTPISFVYSYKLADILAESAKKQRNIVIAMIISKVLFISFVMLIVPVLVLVDVVP